MNLSNLTSGSLTPSNTSSGRASNVQRKSIRHGEKLWLRLFSVLILSSMLLSPAGMLPARAAFAPPALLSPVDGNLVTPDEAPPLGIPEFVWEAVPGATEYHLQVASDIGFTTAGIKVNIKTENTHYTPTNQMTFSDTDYFWRVSVSKPTPEGSFSDVWQFTKRWATATNAPVLNAPTEGQTISFLEPPIFSWTPVMGASKYYLQVYTTPGGWNTLVGGASVITLTTTYQPDLKLADGTYYWRVVPMDVADHNGTASAEHSFTVDYLPNLTLLTPDPTTITYPTFTPTFSWTAVKGARYYILQYSSDYTFQSDLHPFTVRNTSYTPTAAIENDVNNYWRVQAVSGNSTSPWVYSYPNYFRKQWYIKPVLLTPTSGYGGERYPLFSWTPVPDASYYEITIADNEGLNPYIEKGITANPFYTPTKYPIAPTSTTIFWGVTPYEAAGNAGKPSEVSQFKTSKNDMAPEQVYPLYYYPPNVFPPPFNLISSHPYEDRTVAEPIFVWHHVLKPAGDPDEGNSYGEGYRIQVATSSDFNAGSIEWQEDTETNAAVPTVANPFLHAINPATDYFWRVCVLISGNCDLDPVYSLSNWSQIWKTRIDPSKKFPATSSSLAPTLIRPTDGYELIEMNPLLEWYPVAGATSYQVQISVDSGFTALVEDAYVNNPAYVPTDSLGQRTLGTVNFGNYWWRVRKASGPWSTARRFQIAAQSQWAYTRTLGNAANRLQIGSDLPVGPGEPTTDTDYDLTDLQATQSNINWYFGFHVPAAPTKDVTYALYLDLDHQASSGGHGVVDPRGYTVNPIPGYWPEYVIYVDQVLGAFSPSQAYLYKWGGSSWGTVQAFPGISGMVQQNGNYVEISLPSTVIGPLLGSTLTSGSYAISLVSLPIRNPITLLGSGTPRDSVPSDPNAPGSGAISRFANVSERMNLLAPFTNAGIDDLSLQSSILPLFWDSPIRAPFAGVIIRAYLDPGFTNEATKGYFIAKSDVDYFDFPHHAVNIDFGGDNTYYWRVQPRYLPGPYTSGAWTQGWNLERVGLKPQNLRISVTFATPTFSWDMVEGAKDYSLQVDNDRDFSSPITFSPSMSGTRQISYTPGNLLTNGTYYWRVKANRYGDIENGWTEPASACPAAGQEGCFTLALSVPGGLTPPSDTIVHYAPTLCWNPVIVSPTPGAPPVLAAWKYKIQISKDSTFSSTAIWDEATIEQRCWTPATSMVDQTYYWRVAIVLDGSGVIGAYSPYRSFIKQYPVPHLVSPLGQESFIGAPTFIWDPVYGAGKYKIQIAKDQNFSSTSLIETVTTLNTSYTPLKKYATSGTYYWRVAIIDDALKEGPYSDAIILAASTTPIYLPLVVR